MLTIRLLGQFDIRLDGKPVVLRTRASQTLAAWLLLKPGITHRREHIAGTIWPESTEKNARGNLRHALWELRQAIPDGCVQANQMSITWHSGAAYTLDVDLLLQDEKRDETTAQVELAVAAYTGELLPGFYEDWVTLERERLHARFEEKSARLLELLLAEERWRDVLTQAEKWIALGHTPEPAYGALMTAHAALGDLAGASKAWQRCVDALERELGVPPSPETGQLYADIRKGIHTRQSPSVSLGPPALLSQTTPFVGRVREVAALRALLTDPDRRLVTILGVGGMGKSRLALAALEGQQTHFPDGIYFVPLAGVENPAAIAPAILAALHFPFHNDHRSPRQQLIDTLAERRLLLLLDNFEHLLAGSDLLVEMLQAAPGLHLLVTNRERLHLHAETLFRLAGMGYSGQEQGTSTQAESSEAVELFVQSARRVRLHFDPRPEMEALVRICQLVGGMPLALVLAAAWADILSPTEIAAEISQGPVLLAAELTDLAERHRSIHAVFAQSWERLDTAEQNGLMALSVFVDGFSRGAAQAVAGAGLRTLAVLTDRSLLQRGGDGRYSLHELVRQFTGKKLIEAGQGDTVRKRHSHWFLAFVAQREAALKGRGQAVAMAEMEADLPNIRAAWRWAAKMRYTTDIATALESLGIFYYRIQYWSAGESAMEQAIAGLGGAEDIESRFLLLRLRAWYAYFLHFGGQPQTSAAVMEQCLESLNDPSLAGQDTRQLRAFLYLHRGGLVMGDLNRERTADEQAQAVNTYEELGEKWWQVRALRASGNLDIFRVNYPLAKVKLTTARHIAEKIGDKNGLINVLDRLSHIAEYTGQVDEAERLINEAIELNQDDSTFHMNLHTRRGLIKNATGRFQEAADELEKMLDRLRRLGGIHSTPFPFSQNCPARVYIHLGRYEAARELANDSVAAWKRNFGWEHPFLLRTVGRAHLGLGQWEEGHRILSQVLISPMQGASTGRFKEITYLTDFVYAQLAVGEAADARQRLAEAIVTINAVDEYPSIIKSLPAAGLLLALNGEMAQAAAIHQLCLRYPHIANSRWFAVVAMDRLAEAVGDVPPDSTFDTLDTRADLPAITKKLLILLI